ARPGNRRRQLVQGVPGFVVGATPGRFDRANAPCSCGWMPSRMSPRRAHSHRARIFSELFLPAVRQRAGKTRLPPSTVIGDRLTKPSASNVAGNLSMTAPAWIRKKFEPRTLRTVRKHRAQFRPCLEALESRLVPAFTLGTTALLEGPAVGSASDIVTGSGAW